MSQHITLVCPVSVAAQTNSTKQDISSKADRYLAGQQTVGIFFSHVHYRVHYPATVSVVVESSPHPLTLLTSSFQSRFSSVLYCITLCLGLNTAEIFTAPRSINVHKG
jgi:hypothetical protein